MKLIKITNLLKNKYAPFVKKILIIMTKWEKLNATTYFTNSVFISGFYNMLAVQCVIKIYVNENQLLHLKFKIICCFNEINILFIMHSFKTNIYLATSIYVYFSI